MSAYMVVGTQFPDFASLEHCIKEYEKENHLSFYKRDIRTIRNASQRLRRAVHASDERIEKLIYYSIKYACIFGGKTHVKKPTQSSKPRQKKSLKQDCPAYIKVLLGEDQDCLKIVGVNAEHNHDTSEELYKKLPKHRKLGKEEEERVKKLLNLKVDRKLLLEQIEAETGKPVTLKDLYNIASRTKNKKDLVANLADVASVEPLIANQTPNASFTEPILPNQTDASNFVEPYSPMTISPKVEFFVGDEATFLEPDSNATEDDHSYEEIRVCSSTSEKEVPRAEFFEETRKYKQSKLDFLKEIEAKKLKLKEEKLKLKETKIKLLEEQNQLLKQVINKLQ